MEQLLPESWVYMHFALILIITAVQMLVIYILGGASNPPAGLGMYTVYFMAALLGWIAFTLQQGTGDSVAVHVPSVAVIISSYILFLAAGQRSGYIGGRLILGIACLLASLSSLLLSPQQMFLVQIVAATVFFCGAGLISGWRGHRTQNIGDGIIGLAALFMIFGLAFTLYYALVKDRPDVAQAVAFGGYSVAYVLVTIGFLASVLIEYQSHLSQLATHDPLTRVYNRRGMSEALQLTLAAAARREVPTSAIMIDIDHCRQINASFGPETGDMVIRKIADILVYVSRASDVVSRVDGEKFMLILPETDLDPARILAERIRLAIGEEAMMIEQQPIAVTVSIGVASAEGHVNLDELSRKAENAMILAKQGGRNQVASFDNAPIHLTARQVRN